LIDVKDAARDIGTTVAVRDLFFNTPARRKFMRSEATENYHLTSIVTHYALAHPEIGFTLTNNGREILRVSPAKDLKERAYQIFGSGLFESLIPVDGGREFIAKVSGFVSAPRERRTTRDAQYFFVNRRFVRDKTLAGGLLEGYRSILPHGVYPVAFLFVEIPLEEIDVNVHPAKTEIRFRRTEAVKDVIAEAVRGALASAGIVAEIQPGIVTQPTAPAIVIESIDQQEPHEQRPMEFPIPDEVNEVRFENDDVLAEREPVQITLPSTAVQDDLTELSVDSEQFELLANDRIGVLPTSEPVSQIGNVSTDLSKVSFPPLNSAASLAQEAKVEDLRSRSIRPLGQLHESFIIAVDDEGLLLIDQHVAHERILFDKFKKSETDRSTESQNLLLPETLDLSPAQLAAFTLVEADLASVGFSVMRLSGRTIAIKSIPTDLPAGETRNLLCEILDAIEPEKRGGAKAIFRDDIAASLACRAAVKINMKLTPEKMEWLIDRLLTTSSPTTCPHGRPVVLRLTMKDIEKGFHRT
jgi:DNA mismatch repair protein MutL